jgi:redox-sensing transcriptional repressor
VRASNPEGQSGQPRGAGVPPAQRNPRAEPAARAERDGARGIPDASIARLPRYLRALQELAEAGLATVSSEELAAASCVNSAKLRRDLSYLGSYGTRGVGYPVDYLVYQIERALGLARDWPVVIVGVGNLGRALANYGGFATRGLRVACLVDADARRIGEIVGGLPVRHVEELDRLVMKHRVAIGVVATPPAAAQEVCDRLVAAGVRSILNFASAVVVVPDGVELRSVDLSTELQILAFHEQRRRAARADGSIVPEQSTGAESVMPA